MTAIWGPLGWMTLHSVSMLYPESPSVTDKMILKRYMELFRDSITCPDCHNHFKVIMQNYITSHPDWANSRFDFFLFVSRAHNTVNRRLNKPKLDTVQACIDAIENNTKINSALTYRMQYLNHISRNYGGEMSGDNLMKSATVRELRKITNEYWNVKSDISTASFNMTENVLEFIDENASSRRVLTSSGLFASIPTKGMNFAFRGGRFQLT